MLNDKLLLSPEDAELLNELWYDNGFGYAYSKARLKPLSTIVLERAGTPKLANTIVRRRNSNKLDNRRENLLTIGPIVCYNSNIKRHN